MTDKELRRLSRRELLELLVEQSRENDRLKEQLERANQLLNDRRIQIDQAGSIAEAALQINQVFAAAQQAADQYLESIRTRDAQQEELFRRRETESIRKANDMLAETERRCRALEDRTAENCAGMIRQARQTFTSLHDTAASEEKPEEKSEENQANDGT